MEQKKDLEFINSTHRSELAFHRDSIFHTFRWATTVNVALIGGFLALVSSKRLEAGMLLALSVFAGILAIGLYFTAVGLLKKANQAVNANAKLLARVSRAQGYFDSAKLRVVEDDGSDGPVYPDKWKKWGATGSEVTYVRVIKNTLRGCLLVVLLAVGVVSYQAFSETKSLDSTAGSQDTEYRKE